MYFCTNVVGTLGKTNPEGEARDGRFVKGDVAGAVRTLRAAAGSGPEDRVVPLSPQMVGLRFQAAARAAGVEPVTAHSGRVGLASELTSRGGVDDRRDAGRELEDLSDGGVLLGRGDGRARGGGAVPLNPVWRARRPAAPVWCLLDPVAVHPRVCGAATPR